MLVFVPGYDEPTNSNLQLVQKLKLDSANFLLQGDAQRVKLLNELQRENSIFIMSHGAKDAVFYKKDGKALICNDASTFKNKIFFVFACHTATKLGRIMADNSNIWWGYTGAISAPDSDVEAQDIIKKVFQYILEHFDKTNMMTKPDINEVLLEIKELCDMANHELDLLDDDLNYIGTRLCLEHFWNRLRIWCKEKMHEPIKHPDAPAPFLMD